MFWIAFEFHVVVLYVLLKSGYFLEESITNKMTEENAYMFNILWAGCWIAFKFDVIVF